MAKGGARNTRALRDRWTEYRAPGYVPEAFVDGVRHALLSTGTYVTPTDRQTATSVAAVVSTMRRLGYAITIADGVYTCANPEHDPTPEQWSRGTQARGPEVVASTNGHAAGAALDRPGASRGRSRRVRTVEHGPSPEVVAMLPAVGDVLVVTLAGFAPDGGPIMQAERADGWIYVCRIESSRPRP